MIGHPPPVDIYYSGDDSDGPEPENRDSKAESFKNLSYTQLEEKIEKWEGHISMGNQLKLPDDGAKVTKYLENLKNEKESRRIKRSQATFTLKSRDIEILGRAPGTFGDVQTRRGTKATTQPELPPVHIDCSADDSGAPEPEDRDSKAKFFKNLSDTQLEDDIEKYEGFVSMGNHLKLPDDGAKVTEHLENLKNEKESRRIKRSQATSTPKSRDIEILGRAPGTFGDVQTRHGTKATAQPE